LTFATYASGTLSKGNTPTDFGFLNNIWEYFVDIALVGFNFYTDCTFELSLMALGNFFSKTSSAYNLGNNIAYILYNGYSNPTSNMGQL
jgi:hypothetical protein